jgi:hypothetical protein
MAETPIESFCENLLNQNNNYDENEDFNININHLNETNNNHNNNNNNHSNNNDNNNNENKNLSISNKERNKNEKMKNPSWIRSVFLTAISYANYTAIIIIIIFLICCTVRLSLEKERNKIWCKIVLEPIVSILLCLFPLSFALPLGLLIVESATTAGFLATSEVILNGDTRERDRDREMNSINESSKTVKNEKKSNSENTSVKKNSEFEITNIEGENSFTDFSTVNNPMAEDSTLNGRRAGKYDSPREVTDEIPESTNTVKNDILNGFDDKFVNLSGLNNTDDVVSTFSSTAGGKYTNKTVAADEGE